MDLKGILPKKPKKEFFWAFVIEPDWVQAGIWSIEEGEVKVNSVGPASPWKSDEELVSASDSALSASVQDFPENQEEPSKTVFGIANSWAEDGQIKKEYLPKIKKICDELSLTPIGFVVLSESIAHLMKTEEKVPLSAIIAGVGAENIELSIVKNGKISGQTTIARSVSFEEDMLEGLTRIGDLDLPMRIVLYNGKDIELEEIRQNLENADWSKNEKIKFVHPPKIEIINSEKKVVSTALAGGSELAKATAVSFEEEKREEVHQEESEKMESGFVVGEDIQNIQETDFEPGDTVTDDFIQSSIQTQQKLVDHQPKIDHPQMVSQVEGNTESTLMKKGNPISKVKLFVLGLLPKKKARINESEGMKSGRNVILYGIIGFVVIMIGGFVYWWFVPKAEVTVYVSPKKIEDRVEVTLDPKTDGIDEGNSTIGGDVVETQVAGDKTKPTTGKKTVGERASGKVKIYRSGSRVTLSSGTEIESSNGLVFTLNDEVVVASGSASTPGTAEADVTASDIGSEYNLTSGQNFSVGNYPDSELEAKSESDFSGGSSKEISAVSEDDQDELLNELSDELLDNAYDKLTALLDDGQFLVKETMVEESSDANFSNKVGDEASNLKLSLELSYSGVAISQQNLSDYATKLLEPKVPDGFKLRNELIDVSFEFIEEEDGKYILDAIFRANLLPEVKPEELSAKIAGKYPELAKDYLVSIEGFERAEISIKPKLPGKLGNLPRIKKNIEVSVAASQ